MCINISQWSNESASGHLLNVGVSSRYLFRPFGVYLGLRAKPHRPPSTNTVLEDFYRKSTSSKQKISDADVGQLADKLGMKTRQIERWIRRRRVMDRPSTLDKFAESRLLISTFLLAYSGLFL